MSEEMRRRAKAMAEEAEALGLNEREFRVACSIGIDVIQRTLKLHEETHREQIRREVVEEIVSYLLPRLCVLCERGYGVESEVFTSGWRHVGPRGAFKGYCSAAHVRNFAEQEASDGK